MGQAAWEYHLGAGSREETGVATRDVLVLLHGVTLKAQPDDHQGEYDRLWAALKRERGELESALAKVIRIEWAHEPKRTPTPPVTELREDERIMRAENFIDDRTRHDWVRSDRSPYHHPSEAWPGLMTFLARVVSRFTLRRFVVTPIKRQVMVRGFTDAIYYSSPDGERAARRAVYGQLLAGLEEYENDTVRLHVVAHSLGVTVAFDFLYGLFAETGGAPDFITENERSDAPEVLEAVNRYRLWREKAKDQTLQLGSKASAGGQLPLLLMRKQTLVNRLAGHEKLGVDVIGIRPDDQVKWKIFYDPDDVLGFPARRLFGEQAAIQEYEVETGWNPIAAHTGYWGNAQVQRETALLIAQNLGP